MKNRSLLAVNEQSEPIFNAVIANGIIKQQPVWSNYFILYLQKYDNLHENTEPLVWFNIELTDLILPYGILRVV